jgi:hypothetical protein
MRESACLLAIHNGQAKRNGKEKAGFAPVSFPKQNGPVSMETGPSAASGREHQPA